MEAQPALSALSGQALTPAELGTALRPRIHKRHWTEGLARGEIQHQARPHSRQTCLAVQLERILNAFRSTVVVTPASLCLTFPQQSEKEIQEDPLRCVFLQEVPIEMEGSQNVDSQPQGSVSVNTCKTEVNSSKREERIMANNFLNRRKCLVMLVWRSPLSERDSKNSPPTWTFQDKFGKYCQGLIKPQKMRIVAILNYWPLLPVLDSFFDNVKAF